MNEIKLTPIEVTEFNSLYDTFVAKGNLYFYDANTDNEAEFEVVVKGVDRWISSVTFSGYDLSEMLPEAVIEQAEALFQPLVEELAYEEHVNEQAMIADMKRDEMRELGE